MADNKELVQGRFQLRGCNENHDDTGELRYVDSLEEAFDLLLSGGYWKLSWTTSAGRRLRLLREDNILSVTYVDDLARSYWEEEDNG